MSMYEEELLSIIDVFLQVTLNKINIKLLLSLIVFNCHLRYTSALTIHSLTWIKHSTTFLRRLFYFCSALERIMLIKPWIKYCITYRAASGAVLCWYYSIGSGNVQTLRVPCSAAILFLVATHVTLCCCSNKHWNSEYTIIWKQLNETYSKMCQILPNHAKHFYKGIWKLQRLKLKNPINETWHL